VSLVHRLFFWIGLDIFLGIIIESIPEKARKIIGSILLIFGAVAIFWATTTEIDGLARIGVIAVSLWAVFSILLGTKIWWEFLFNSWGEIEDEEYISPGSSLENRKQQIDCSSCNQKLNIPFGYIGAISCPACGIYIELNEGIIQVENTTLVEENESKVLELNEGILQVENTTFVEGNDSKVLELDEMTDLIWLIWGLLSVMIFIFSFYEYGYSRTFGFAGFTIIGAILLFILLPVICIISGILIMIFSKLNLVKTDGDWGELDIIQSVYSEIYPEKFNEKK